MGRASSVEDVGDAELVAALRAGEHGSAAALFDRHAPRIERVLYRMLGPNVDLADPLNETFCRALDKLAELVEPAGLRRWLLAIAVNVAREHRRSQRRMGWLEYHDPASLPEVAIDEPSIETREAVRALFSVLDTMIDEERSALVLRHFEGLGLDELAVALGVSLATAKRHLGRAEGHFFARTCREPALAAWIERSS